MSSIVRARIDGKPSRDGKWRGAIASRVLAAIVGGWLFAAGFVVLCIALGLRAGLSYADAQTLSWLVVFLVYVAIVCGSFAARSAWRVWLVLLGGSALMTGSGWWLMGSPA